MLKQQCKKFILFINLLSTKVDSYQLIIILIRKLILPAESASLQLQHGGMQRHVLARHHGVHGRVDGAAEQLHLSLQLGQPVEGRTVDKPL